MAGPVRVDIEGGWYHITNRGQNRGRIFHEARDYEHFLELLEEMTGRYGVRVHAYVLTPNHYHLIIETPRASASVAIQRVNVSYMPIGATGNAGGAEWVRIRANPPWDPRLRHFPHDLGVLMGYVVVVSDE